MKNNALICLNKGRYQIKLIWRFMVIALSLVAPVVLFDSAAKAQDTDSSWSDQRRLFDHYFDSFAPKLIADQNKTVHAFHFTDLEADSSDEGVHSAIFYRQWRADAGWTVPIDIILPADAPEFSLQGVFLDNAGYFHLIYYEGEPSDGAIYYSRAHEQHVDRASAWSDPIMIGEAAGPLASAALVGDGDGNLFVLYGGRVQESGLYAVHSTDAGENWSFPELVYLEYQARYYPLFIDLIVDEQGRAHATWSVFSSESIASEEVYYASGGAHDQEWSEPIKLAERDTGDFEADWPSIVAYGGELIVLYQDGNPATRWMRRSPDGGETWTEPTRPFELAGENGAAVFLIDGDHDLHVVMANRTSKGVVKQGMWHSVWRGEQWSPVEAIVSGPQTPDFDPTQPEAVISQGNVLLTVWTKDTTAGPRNGVWYASSVLDAGELATVPLPTAFPTPTSIPTLTPQSEQPVTTQAMQAGTIDFDRSYDLEQQGSSRLEPIVVGLLAAGVFVISVVGVRLLRTAQR